MKTNKQTHRQAKKKNQNKENTTTTMATNNNSFAYKKKAEIQGKSRKEQEKIAKTASHEIPDGQRKSGNRISHGAELQTEKMNTWKEKSNTVQKKAQDRQGGKALCCPTWHPASRTERKYNILMTQHRFYFWVYIIYKQAY